MTKEIYPQMHTAEHILNQTMDRLFGCGRCFSSHIERKKSKCDYQFKRNLSDEEVEDIENRVNSVINDDLAVTEEYITRQEALKSYDIGRLPPDAGNAIRIIKVGDYDACPCSGPHIGSTKIIGGMRITSHSFENGVLRIRFKLVEPMESPAHHTISVEGA